MRFQDDMMDLTEIRTDKFKPFLPDDAQVNPGVYGAELAYWLAQQLAARGVMTSYPQAEDWGWYLCYTSRDGDCRHTQRHRRPDLAGLRNDVD